ncbi:MAG: DUF6171 family protein [Acetobacter sp.]|nr:DUF6171 family protein [Bacteroides sp.]MCM1341434.1 DUF6171 family protein [Acetobacter sp.]MCM1433388.1 DUF6171 family protein [Clostridiales bacterium]
MENICKKCLLLEAGETKSYKSLSEYIETLEESCKVSDDVYNRRLSLCKKCDNLIAGMCIKCGCYVELRAVYKNRHCADYNVIKW